MRTRRPIPLCEPSLGGNEALYLSECIETNFVSSVGPFVERFETAFAKRTGVSHAVACSSGTAALHVALLIAGARSESVVPVSTFTFIASVNAVSYTGARALLVDSESATWNMDTEALYDHVDALSVRGEQLPAVIQVVHILGHPAQMEPLLELRERFGIPIVEDAAEALGATWTAGQLKGVAVGAAGDLGCFSFNGNKVMTAGGGGMIVTNDAALADQARHLTTQARLPGPAYVHDQVGYNYRLTNLAAAVGLAQLEQLDGFLQSKAAIATRYIEALGSREDIQMQPSASWANPSWWLPSVLCETKQRDPILRRMAERSIDARPVWIPAHLQAPHRKAQFLGGAVAEGLAARGISLPASVSLSAPDQESVIEAFG